MPVAQHHQREDHHSLHQLGRRKQCLEIRTAEVNIRTAFPCPASWLNSAKTLTAGASSRITPAAASHAQCTINPRNIAMHTTAQSAVKTRSPGSRGPFGVPIGISIPASLLCEGGDVKFIRSNSFSWLESP